MFLCLYFFKSYRSFYLVIEINTLDNLVDNYAVTLRVVALLCVACYCMLLRGVARGVAC